MPFSWKGRYGKRHIHLHFINSKWKHANVRDVLKITAMKRLLIEWGEQVVRQRLLWKGLPKNLSEIISIDEKTFFCKLIKIDLNVGCSEWKLFFFNVANSLPPVLARGSQKASRSKSRICWAGEDQFYYYHLLLFWPINGQIWPKIFLSLIVNCIINLLHRSQSKPKSLSL